jgi:hypothetical protein
MAEQVFEGQLGGITTRISNMRWKLLIAACLPLAAPTLDSAAAATRPQGGPTTCSDDCRAGRQTKPGKAEHSAKRDRIRTSADDSGSRPDLVREREEHGHDRDDD